MTEKMVNAELVKLTKRAPRTTGAGMILKLTVDETETVVAALSVMVEMGENSVMICEVRRILGEIMIQVREQI